MAVNEIRERGEMTARRPQVPEWLSTLDGRIDLLEGTLTDLEGRLEPVLVAPGLENLEKRLPVDKRPEVPLAALVGIADRLRTQVERVVVLNERIMDLMKRLEI